MDRIRSCLGIATPHLSSPPPAVEETSAVVTLLVTAEAEAAGLLLP